MPTEALESTEAEGDGAGSDSSSGDPTGLDDASGSTSLADDDGAPPDAPNVCPDGRADCDGDADNGCETDLESVDHCGACWAGCGSLRAGTVTCTDAQCSAVVGLEIAADTWIEEVSPHTNHGAASQLVVDVDAGPRKIALLVPDADAAAELDASAIVRMSLRLHVDDAGHPASAHAVTSAWNESTVTWATQPTFDPVILGHVEGTLGFVWLDVTAAASGPWSTHGFALLGQGENGLRLSSRTHAMADRHPMLEVELSYAPR